MRERNRPMGYLGVVALVTMGLSWLVLTWHLDSVGAAYTEAHSTRLADLLATRLRFAVLQDSAEDAGNELAQFATAVPLISVQVMGADGEVLAQLQSTGHSSVDNAPTAHTTTVSRPVYAGKRPVGSVYLELPRPEPGLSTPAGLALILAPLLVLLAAVVPFIVPGLWRSRADRGVSAGSAPNLEGGFGSATARGEADNEPDALRRELATRTDELAEARKALGVVTEAKSRFLANMSHEIRTPLNGVLGMTELLLDTELNGKQRRFAYTVRRSAEALLNIVNDILDFSRMESGRLRLEELDYNLRETVEDVSDLLAENAACKGLELVSRIADDIPTLVRGDSTRLRQVLTNLVSNAIKFTERGEVLVRVHLLESSTEQARFQIEVSDTGIGIPPKLAGRIFESFVQADSSTTRRYGGAGLGLAISKHLVELMGGSMEVESEPGRGSRFTFQIQVKLQQETKKSNEQKSALINGTRALIVDDNGTNRSILAHQLGAWGIVNDGVADADSAIRALHEAKASNELYEVAILDMQMPGTDGLTLARMIKSDEAIREVKLLMLTSVVMDIGAEELREAGIDQYTTKPVRQSQLYNCLANLVGASDEAIGTHPLTTVPKNEAEVDLRGKVLLAEDNSVNQEVAIDMLEKFGFDVRLVDNGKSALEAWERERFDVVLMDCQMPVMDGFETTADLRERERAMDTRHHTPIVALTANALAGDRERCLAAGMDDYISKPFKQAELRDTLMLWIGGNVNELDGGCMSATAVEPRRSIDSDYLDASALATLRDMQRPGKADVLAKVARLYVRKAPILLGDIKDAIVAGDASALQMAAHTLKSSSANLGATELADICLRLEQKGRVCELDGAPDELPRLEVAVLKTSSELRRICLDAGASDADPEMQAASA